MNAVCVCVRARKTKNHTRDAPSKKSRNGDLGRREAPGPCPECARRLTTRGRRRWAAPSPLLSTRTTRKKKQRAASLINREKTSLPRKRTHAPVSESENCSNGSRGSPFRLRDKLNYGQSFESSDKEKPTLSLQLRPCDVFSVENETREKRGATETLGAFGTATRGEIYLELSGEGLVPLSTTHVIASETHKPLAVELSGHWLQDGARRTSVGRRLRAGVPVLGKKAPLA